MAGALSGDVLPPQVIYKGKTDACHAKYNFPDDWDVTHTENHWANKDTSFRYLDKIIVPYVNKVRDEHDLPLRQKALIILDFFSAQLSEEFRERMKELGLVYVYVPPNCTSELQPMDLSVQKIVKDHMRDQFETWYAEKVASILQDGGDIEINLGMSVLKPLSAKWLDSAIAYLKKNPEKVFNGFKKAGISDALGLSFDF